MNFIKTFIDGVIRIEPIRFQDERGFFSETYNLKAFKGFGIDTTFIQDNYSLSKKVGTVRGLHFQKEPFGQAKLVKCSKGKIFDVVVDLRKNSSSYGKWYGIELSPENGIQLFIPVGLAHGFMTLEPNTEITYKCSNIYSPSSEGSLRWNDPDIGIDWPLNINPSISEKDSSAPFFKQFKTPFI